MSEVNVEYYTRRARQILDSVCKDIENMSTDVREGDPNTWGPFIAMFKNTGSKLEQLVETYNKELEGKL